MKSRTERALEVIALVHGNLPEGESFKDRKAAIKAAYPFGERSYWPYKAWCKAQREYLKRYDPKTPPPPLLRDLLTAGRDDIIFPFAGENK
jgi:hypothetical protein